MKIQYKNIITSTLVLGFIISPFYGFAAETKRIKEKNSFCERIDTVTSKITSEIDKKTEKFTGKKENRFTNLNNKWGSRDENRLNNRSSQNTKIDARFDSLMNKGDTDVKKEAILKFKQDVSIAVNTRRDSIDSAISSFRDGVDGLVNGKFNDMDSRVLVLKNSINTSINNAKSSCNSGVQAETVRTTLKNNIKESYDIFRQSKTDKEIKSEIDKLSLLRKQSVSQAVEKFKDDMEKIKSDLKIVLGA